MLIPATTPNSCSIALLVNAKTAKPMAAVTLQKRVTTPILLTMSIRARFLSEVEGFVAGVLSEVEIRNK